MPESTSQPPPVRLVLADDEALLRRGLRVLLEAGGRVRVVAEAGDGRQLVDAVVTYRPDVALIDVQMPGTDGLDALRTIQQLPEPPVCAILTTFDIDEYVARALDLGAQGFLLKDAEPEALVRAVVDLAAGGAVLDPRITARLLPLLRQSGSQLRSARAVTELSGRERQVLDLVSVRPFQRGHRKAVGSGRGDREELRVSSAEQVGSPQPGTGGVGGPADQRWGGPMNWAELLSRVPRPARIVVQEIVVVGASLGVVILSYPPGLSWSEPSAIVACVALPLRLRWPWLAMLCCLFGLTGQLGLAPAQFGLYRIGRTSHSLWVTLAWALAAVAAIETTVFLAHPLSPRDGTMSVLFAILWIMSPSALGMLVRTRERLAASVADLRLAREAELEARADRARVAERARIGREIHDAVGHHATLIAVEAAALEATTTDVTTKTAAHHMRDLAKASLDEMRSALGLTTEGPTNGGLPEIATLITRARQAGMQVDYTVADVNVPPALGRAAFRIVQECLTNAAKHAPGSPVRVSITRDATSLTVTTISGPPTTPLPFTDRAGGLGLTGMAERANSLGGHLQVDTEPPETFTVRAHLPLDGYQQSKVDATEPTIDGTEPALDAR